MTGSQDKQRFFKRTPLEPSGTFNFMVLVVTYMSDSLGKPVTQSLNITCLLLTSSPTFSIATSTIFVVSLSLSVFCVLILVLFLELPFHLILFSLCVRLLSKRQKLTIQSSQCLQKCKKFIFKKKKKTEIQRDCEELQEYIHDISISFTTYT